MEYTPPSNLEVGTTNVTIKAGQTTQLSFIAPAAGTYSFYTTGSQDTYGYLYDENQALLDSDDDDGDNTVPLRSEVSCYIRGIACTYHIIKGRLCFLRL